MKIPTAVVTLMALAAGLLSAAPAATADPASEVTVVWPEVTRFNPTRTTYDVDVTNTGEGHLFYGWGSVDGHLYDEVPVPLPESGSLELDHVESQTGAVQIWSCPSTEWAWAPECSRVASSPELEVYSRLAVGPTFGRGQTIGPGPATAHLEFSPRALPSEHPTATWELLDADQRPLAPAVTGVIDAAPLAAGPEGAGYFPVVVPKTLRSGIYYLSVHMSMDTADFGPLEGTSASSVWTEFYLDSAPPSLRVSKLPPVFYPVRDHYRDVLAVRVSTDEWRPATFEVANKAGQVVYRRRAGVDNDPLYWHGQANRGGHGLVSAGAYTLTLRLADYFGNTAVWTGAITVSRKWLRWKTFKRTVRANASRIGKPFVGRCARLASPASGGPRGSLGFYSESKCRGGAKAGTVFTNHGMHLPKAFEARYAWARVTLNGGPASKSSGNYIVMLYQTPPDSAYTYREEFREGHGAHKGPMLWPDDIFDRTTDNPYIVWSNGLTAGSRYDVRSYTVQVRYRVLR